MRLSEWARRQGISYRTAWRWFHAGTLPVSAEQYPGGTIVVHDGRAEPEPSTGVALYARVSGSEQRGDLERQIGRLTTYATQRGWAVQQTVSEVGSGLNGKRPKLVKLLADSNVTTIVVEPRDRLARFGSEYIDACLRASAREIVVVESSEMTDDLVEDMVAVMTSFFARPYGRRAARNRAKKAVQAAGNT